jgi:hypothetical protein
MAGASPVAPALTVVVTVVPPGRRSRQVNSAAVTVTTMAA